MGDVSQSVRSFVQRNSTNFILLAIAVRLALLVYGTWQDAHFEVKYSDIDYSVVTDGARLVYEGKSPYQRTTYRYSPLLAYMLVPNITLHGSFGKLIFVLFDTLCAWLVHSLMFSLGYSPHDADLATIAWLWNPLSMTISTRGSGDSIVCAQVLLTLLGLVRAKKDSTSSPWFNLVYAAMAHGLSVHWRLFPIVFAPTILVYLDTWAQRIFFGFVSASVFFGLGLVFFVIYGQEFLQETFLYHLSRTDHRHNFSIWFYALYLALNSTKGPLMSMAAFLPQAITQCCLIWRFGKVDICFAFFVQTWAFVAFNKVVTAQYFLWYVSLLPIAFFSCDASASSLILTMLLPWFVTEIHWLLWGFLVEFQGLSAFNGIFIASAFFFATNILLITRLSLAHTSKRAPLKLE